MTKTQQTKIINIIKKDANFTQRIINPRDSSKMCVIGGLLYKAGYSKVQLYEVDEIGKLAGDKSGLTSFVERDVLYSKYGLDIYNCKKLQRINDRYQNTRTRRRELIKYVKTLPIEK